MVSYGSKFSATEASLEHTPGVPAEHEKQIHYRSRLYQKLQQEEKAATSKVKYTHRGNDPFLHFRDSADGHSD